MRKRLISGFIALFLFVAASEVSAQRELGGTSYRNALGLGIDFGDGSTLVGISGKHFFDVNNAGVAEILFGDHITFIQAFYQYNKGIQGAPGLRWYLGVGPTIALYNGGSDFLIRPTGGLEYKINNVPLSFAFDWRPWLQLTHDTNFEAARFGLGFRYTFN
jgi:hypothetical protein